MSTYRTCIAASSMGTQFRMVRYYRPSLLLGLDPPAMDIAAALYTEWLFTFHQDSTLGNISYSTKVERVLPTPGPPAVFLFTYAGANPVTTEHHLPILYCATLLLVGTPGPGMLRGSNFIVPLTKLDISAGSWSTSFITTTFPFRSRMFREPWISDPFFGGFTMTPQLYSRQHALAQDVSIGTLAPTPRANQKRKYRGSQPWWALP